MFKKKEKITTDDFFIENYKKERKQISLEKFKAESTFLNTQIEVRDTHTKEWIFIVKDLNYNPVFVSEKKTKKEVVEDIHKLIEDIKAIFTIFERTSYHKVGENGETEQFNNLFDVNDWIDKNS